MNEFLFKLGLQWEWVGSVAINGEGNDIDIAIRVDPADEVAALEHYRLQGWTSQGAGYRQIVNGNNFSSLKKGDFNILLCYDQSSWDRFVKGRDYCLFLKSIGVDMTNKAVRIAIHAMSAGETLEGVKQDVGRLGVLQA